LHEGLENSRRKAVHSRFPAGDQTESSSTDHENIDEVRPEFARGNQNSKRVDEERYQKEDQANKEWVFFHVVDPFKK
jgi:hypothetical protein